MDSRHIADHHRGLYDQTLSWLYDRALLKFDPVNFLKELACQLNGLGFGLYRILMGKPILHPLYVAGAMTWYPGNRVEVDSYHLGALGGYGGGTD